MRRLLALCFLVALLSAVGWVLLYFAEIDVIKNAFVNQISNKIPLDISHLPKPLRPQGTPEPKPVLIAVLVADSHAENDRLRLALSQAKAKGATLAVGLGDYTTVGTAEELAQAKEAFVQADLPFYLLPGDHDLWLGREQQVGPHGFFNQAFGWRPSSQAYQEFEQAGVRFILVDNADNELGISDEQWEWLTNILPKKDSARDSLTFVLMHEAPYHSYSEHIMGRVREPVAKQTDRLRKMLAESAVSHVITGDLHFFAAYSDTEFGTFYTTVGAVAQKRNPQKPRYALLKIFEDKTFVIEDVEIEEE